METPVDADLHEMTVSGVKGALATLDGTPIGEPFVIFPSAVNSGSFAVAFDGDRYVVNAQQFHSANEALYFDLTATHVSRDGVPEGDRFLISSTTSIGSSPRVVAFRAPAPRHPQQQSVPTGSRRRAKHPGVFATRTRGDRCRARVYANAHPGSKNTRGPQIDSFIGRVADQVGSASSPEPFAPPDRRLARTSDPQDAYPWQQTKV